MFVALLLFGAAIVIGTGVSGVVLCWANVRRFRRQARTTGTVIDNRKAVSTGGVEYGTGSTYYYPVIEYYVETRRFKFTSEAGRSRPLTNGTQLPVTYSVDQPSIGSERAWSLAFAPLALVLVPVFAVIGLYLNGR